MQPSLFYVPHLHRFYPLRTWFNGEVHALQFGVDFDSSRKSIRAFLYRQAREYGFSLRTRALDNEGLLIQTYNRDGTPISF